MYLLQSPTMFEYAFVSFLMGLYTGSFYTVGYLLPRQHFVLVYVANTQINEY